MSMKERDLTKAYLREQELRMNQEYCRGFHQGVVAVLRRLGLEDDENMRPMIRVARELRTCNETRPFWAIWADNLDRIEERKQ